MYNSRKRFLLLLTFCMLSVFGVAQNEINTPYSKFGLGNLSQRSNIVLGSMGGVGYALQHAHYINFKNPAAFAAFDSLSFIADLAFAVTNYQLKTKELSYSGNFAKLEYITIGLPVMRMWRTSFGIMPYSSVGYDILDTRVTEHFGKVHNQYQGRGILQLLYWGNAFKLCKGLTLGVNLSYLFGTINSTSFAEYNTEEVPFIRNTMNSNFRYLDGIQINGGVQYHITINEKHRLGIGTVYEKTLKLWSRENLVRLTYANPYSPNTVFDTIKYNVGADAVRTKNAKMPHIIGTGISYGYKDKLLVAADITWQNWKKFYMSNIKDSLQNNLVTALGMQFIPDPLSSKYFKKINLRAGTRFSTGYIVIQNHPISEFAISAGLGFPIRTFNTRSSVNIMFEYSRLGTLQNNLIIQNYYKLTFNFILHEKWYQRRKLE